MRVNQDDKGSRGIRIMPLMIVAGKLQQALEEQRDTPNTHALSFEERLALLVDRERLSRQNRPPNRLKTANS